MSQRVSADTDSGESHGLGPKSEADEALRAALGPIVWKIGALEQQNIKDIFALLKRFFKVFEKNQVVEKKGFKIPKILWLNQSRGREAIGNISNSKSWSLHIW